MNLHQQQTGFSFLPLCSLLEIICCRRLSSFQLRRRDTLEPPLPPPSFPSPPLPPPPLPSLPPLSPPSFITHSFLTSPPSFLSSPSPPPLCQPVTPSDRPTVSPLLLATPPCNRAVTLVTEEQPHGPPHTHPYTLIPPPSGPGCSPRPFFLWVAAAATASAERVNFNCCAVIGPETCRAWRHCFNQTQQILSPELCRVRELPAWQTDISTCRQFTSGEGKNNNKKTKASVHRRNGKCAACSSKSSL